MKMLTRFCCIIALATTGLVAGVFFSEWLGISPVLRVLNAEDYIRMKQAIITAYNPAMPILGIGGSVFYVLWLILEWRNGRSPKFIWALAGFILLTISTAISIGGELPANKEILTLSAQNPAANWEALRLTTLRVIEIRTAFSVLSFIALCIGCSDSRHDDKATLEPTR